MAKKPRLSRGIDDLFSDNSQLEQADEIETTEEKSVEGIKNVKLSLVEPNKNQPRTKFDEEKLKELSESIKEHGILQPILVRPLKNGGYQIVAGERRWRAARLAELTEVPVLVKELDNKKTMQIALLENIQRQDLSPIEEAKAYKELMEYHSMTQDELSQTLGKSRSSIANSLRLLSSCDFVQEALEDGRISVGHAKVLAGLSEQEQAIYMSETILCGYSVRQLEEEIQNSDKTMRKVMRDQNKTVSENSFVKDRPFLKEFEVAVNNASNIKVKAKAEKSGATQLSLKIDKDCDVEAVLSQLAELLSKY